MPKAKGRWVVLVADLFSATPGDLRHLPEVAAHMDALGVPHDESEPIKRRVLTQRDEGVAAGAALPSGPVTLDFDGIDVASTPFLSALREGRDDLRGVNMNEDVAECWNLISERMGHPDA